jgi:hypothetical protein
MRSATRRPLRKTRPHPLSNRKAALSASAGTLAWSSLFSPPHDCRLTIRCLKGSFGFRVEIESLSFEALRSENSFIDHFFERRQDDARAGEGGERIVQIKTHPAFSLHSGRMRGATWFDKSRPPQGIVWLLGAEAHDERHKGSTDAYDIFAALRCVRIRARRGPPRPHGCLGGARGVRPRVHGQRVPVQHISQISALRGAGG